jgi:hypothetical protein
MHCFWEGVMSSQLVRTVECDEPVDVCHCVAMIQSEYFEMPGLHLTKDQMRRLWGMDPDSCQTAVGLLESTRFLRRTAGGAYVRADVGA